MRGRTKYLANGRDREFLRASLFASPMKIVSILLLPCLTASLLAQQPTPAPKKAPFTGFGGSALDRRPGAPPAPSPFSKPGTPMPKLPPLPATPAPSGAAPSAAGIRLAPGWDGRVTEAAGGHGNELEDLTTLLTPYGTAEKDTDAHPEMLIYPGIKYLAPLAEAEKVFFGDSRPSKSVATKLAIAGFPEGLSFASYDIHLGIYNRLFLVFDLAQQVVSVELVGEDVLFVPPSPPFVLIESEWRVYDYINDRIKGQSRIVIDGRVNDLRANGFIIFHTTGTRQQRWSRQIPAPGITAKPPTSEIHPKQATTWYVPKPLINLILYCVGKYGRK